MMTMIFPGWPPEALEKIIYEETDPRQAVELIQHFFDERFDLLHRFDPDLSSSLKKRLALAII